MWNITVLLLRQHRREERGVRPPRHGAMEPTCGAARKLLIPMEAAKLQIRFVLPAQKEPQGQLVRPEQMALMARALNPSWSSIINPPAQRHYPAGHGPQRIPVGKMASISGPEASSRTLIIPLRLPLRYV